MIDILDELKQDFLIYATEVNNNRAFCDARDGLKPGQRAILWDMYENGHFSTKPHVKSAKVSGSTISKWWPHGDASIYEAIVRMSQPWVNNLCEIDFHGANGSLLGGPTAASARYTECRLSTMSEESFFTNIKKDVVPMIDNFSEDEKWPLMLPSILPRLIINGSSGIGYTIAQDWLPHNLIEIVEKIKEYLKTNKLSFDNLYPDFPTGGVIINKSACEEIYKTGKGSIILRGKVNIVDKYINITELPYQIYAEPFIQEIKDLVNSNTITGIEDICNKSDDNGLLIEIECSTDPKVVLAQLYKNTDLQISLSANQMALVNGIPELLNLQKYFDIYIDHNLTCLRKEYQFDLDKANSRLEVVNGLLKALSDIDSIINLIKASKSSATALETLQTTFNFTKVQASAIIDMKLGKLANLERNALVKEADDLNKIVDKCTKFLASDKLQTKEFLSRLDKFTEKYGWQRRTEVCDIDLNEEKKAIKVEKAQERFNIILTKDNELKKVLAGKLKSDDNISKVIEVGEKDRFVLISNTGIMYKLNAKDIKLVSQGSKGQNIKEFFNDEIINIYTGNETEEFLIFITKNGLIKKIESKIVFGLSKLAGAPVMKVEENDKIIYCELKTDSDIINIKSGKKEKQINISDLLSKGRLAGGITTIKGKLKEPIEIK